MEAIRQVIKPGIYPILCSSKICLFLIAVPSTKRVTCSACSVIGSIGYATYAIFKRLILRLNGTFVSIEGNIIGSLCIQILIRHQICICQLIGIQNGLSNCIRIGCLYIIRDWLLKTRIQIPTSEVVICIYRIRNRYGMIFNIVFVRVAYTFLMIITCTIQVITNRVGIKVPDCIEFQYFPIRSG